MGRVNSGKAATSRDNRESAVVIQSDVTDLRLDLDLWPFFPSAHPHPAFIPLSAMLRCIR